MNSFNLIDEPFIPVVRADGSTAEFGLRDVLASAHEIAELRDGSPLVTVSLHRLLLAILHRVYQGPKDVAERVVIKRAGRFDAARITAYFEKWKDRFDLFHAEHPFYQRAGFEIEDAAGTNRLAQELACNNNPTLFDHTTNESASSLSPAEAARATICTQAYAVGGGVSKQGNSPSPIPNLTGAPLIGGAAVLVRGSTLFDTLWLNLIVYNTENGRPIPNDSDDAPIWERDGGETHKDSEEPRGYLDYLTWQSRSLRLHATDESGPLRVTRVSFAQGRRLRPQATLFDPMFAYHRKDKKDPFYPLRFNEFRDLWRESAALYQMTISDDDLARAANCVQSLEASGLREHLPRSARYTASVSGLCTNSQQAADVLFWRHETLPLPLAYLDNPALVEALKFALKLAEEVASDALRKAAWATVANRLTGDTSMNPDKDRVQSLLDAFAPQLFYWSRLERPYRKLLVALAEATGTEARTALVSEWFEKALIPTAIDAFDRSVGQIDGGRDLKATTIGRGLLRRSLNSIRTKNNLPPKPEQQEDAA